MDLKSNDSIEGTLIDKKWFLTKISKIYDTLNKKQIPGHKNSQFGRWSIPESFLNKDNKDQEYEEESHPFYYTLTLIWDLSILEGMAKFMHDTSLHNLFIDIQHVTDVERIKEICVGIIANMTCQQEIGQELVKNSQISLAILQLFIESYDVGVMNECLRYINNTLNIGGKTDDAFYLQNEIAKDLKFLNKLIFTLTFSANESLLLLAIECLCSLLEMDILDFEPTAIIDSLNGIIEAFNQIMSFEVQDAKCRNFVHAYQMILCQRELQPDIHSKIKAIYHMQTFVKYLQNSYPPTDGASSEDQCNFLADRGHKSLNDNTVLACLRNIEYLARICAQNGNGPPDWSGMAEDLKILLTSMHSIYNAKIRNARAENEVEMDFKNQILEEITSIQGCITKIETL